MSTEKKGFTLIELLTVIAIIAVLAGILFPVFASAKLAAKQSGSLSNMKQIVLGSLMYSNDTDDGLPLYASGNALNVGVPNKNVNTWVWTTQPYIKSLAVVVDPGMGDPHGVFGSGPEATPWNQNMYPDYGVNYTFLAPWLRDSNTGQCTQSGSVTASGGTHPANTIFYTTTYEPNEDGSGNPTGGYSDFGSWVVTAPGMLSILQNSPTNCVWKGMDWSQHPSSLNWGEPFTAEASQRYNGGGNNAMLDGHVKHLKADQEAAGTDWAASTYMHTQITHSSQYMWDYNGTFFGTVPPE